MQDNYDVNDEMTKLLLKHGSNVNVRTNYDTSPLHLATSFRHEKGLTPLDIAVINKQETFADLLTSNEADINARNEEEKTPLIMLISSGEFYDNYLNIVELLLKHGARVNSRDIRGKTALHYACRGNCLSDIHVNLVKLLLKYGARVNSKDNDRKTALHYACYFKLYGRTVRTKNSAAIEQKDIMNLLLKHGARVNSRDKHGITALHYACYFKLSRGRDDESDIIKLLLKSGARVNSQDNDGKTALHFACYSGCNEAVEELLEHGSDINITCKDGRTALDSLDPLKEKTVELINTHTLTLNVWKILTINYSMMSQHPFPSFLTRLLVHRIDYVYADASGVHQRD
ncbi:hypothetical protein QYM36_005654 [Artemia franciscana]|uniref:Uncharacterized protein n=1 Tax=Artemia franciscana TaxID=6661 RepID=A0AA88HYT9_ARTSF|nr:hypothetical protein QYM36_005654 [Artemia franciscana]